MTLCTLEELYNKHTGKVSDKWSAYLHEYERVFRDHREQPVRLLEIGVQNGGSLEIWKEYFPLASKLVGCDINPDCARLRYEDPRITVIVADANTDAAQAEISAQSAAFEIIIDDGSHRSSDIVRSFSRYFPLLTDGGVFVIEDLHCSYWAEFEGGLYDPFSAISFLKRLADTVHHEHWGVPKASHEVLRGIFEHYDTGMNEEELSHVHSIEFSNSMCVIRKARRIDNLVGTRFISGTIEDVVSGHLDLHGSARAESNQEGNPWSNRDLPPDQELPQRLAELAAANATIGALRGEVAARDQQLEAFSQEVAKHRREVAAGAAAIVDLARTAVARDTQYRGLQIEHRDSKRRVGQLKRSLKASEKTLASTLTSPSWRLTRPLRITMKGVRRAVAAIEPPGGYYRASRRVRKVLREKGLLRATQRMIALGVGRAAPAPIVPSKKLTAKKTKKAPSDQRNDYAEWLRRYDTLTAEDRTKLVSRASAFDQKPLFSVLMPTYNSDPQWLVEAIESVRGQIYPHWELCIADDASTSPVVRSILEYYARKDPRIKVVYRERNGHISEASNSALELASGPWVALLDHDDVLREHALFWVADAINREPDLRLIYSDEDKVGLKGQRFGPYFKPDWNEDLFRSHNLICHLGVYEAALVREVGGFRVGFEGAQDYDLALRCVERLHDREIHHIARVLYSWRAHAESTAKSGASKPYAQDAGQRAIDEHFLRRGIDARTEMTPFGMYRARYALPASAPMVSLIIPTRNAHKLVRQCVESIHEHTSYSNYEILLIDNGSDDPEAISYFASLAATSQARVIRDERPFNYSSLNNAAVKSARGELVCLVNNDIEVVSPDWLSEMVSLALQPGVGAVGARLWFPNNTLQHGGVVLGIGGVAGHAHKHLEQGDPGYFARAAVIQSWSAVTAACLVVKKAIYEEVGGLNEAELAIAFNDVDLCLRIREAGYRNLWTPYAELYHHESATRGYEDTPEKKARFAREVTFMKKRWGQALLTDPAYSPNLTITLEDFSLAWPPRLTDSADQP